jgi:hypothetical protein
MKQFLKKHEDRLVGILSGLDRIIFNATPGFLRYAAGVEMFLSANRIHWRDFGKLVHSMSDKVKAHAEQMAKAKGRTYQYLQSANVSKENLARQIMERDGIEQGLVCVLSCVELCQTYGLGKNRSGQWGVKPQLRKCLHLYFYFVDREFGLMHIRLQSWLPFRVQIYVNGREWLARRLQRAGINFEKQDNCITHVEDWQRAQGYLDELLVRNWVPLLNAWVRRVNPWAQSRSRYPIGWHYWCVRQSEYATDLIFDKAATLEQLYPALVRHAITDFQTPDVLRFLGRKQRRGKVWSRMLEPMEGLRVKHWVEENSIKMYNKGGHVLRVETTINNPRRFKTRRWITKRGRRVLTWGTLRKSVMDLKRRAAVSDLANRRYLQALAAVGTSRLGCQVLDPVSRPVIEKERRYRALRPISPEDSQRLGVLIRGEFLIGGFRNRDLHAGWDNSAQHTEQQISGQITRWLRILRAHRVIYKIPATHRYQLTQKGRELITTARRLRTADIAALAA